MMVFWLIILLSSEPGPTFGVVHQYENSFDCEDAVKKAPDNLRPKLHCLPVVLVEIKSS